MRDLSMRDLENCSPTAYCAAAVRAQRALLWRQYFRRSLWHV